MTTGMKCPKCGLMQLPGPNCKSCGTALGGPARHPTPPKPPVTRLSAPAPIPARPKNQEERPVADEGVNDSRRLSFEGSGGSLFGIQVVNMFLTIATLGVYYFWGKVKVRRYLLSETEFEGDRLAYHGTGKELLIGWLKALLVFGLPVGVLQVVAGLPSTGVVIKGVAGLVLYGVIMVFIPVAMVGARRYRLSRTSWREIRFSFRGRALDFIKLFVGGSLLSAITLGLYYPIFDTRRYAFMVSHSYFGNEKFHFDGQGRDLFGSYVLALLLFLPTLGLSWFWFIAKKQRYFWDHTAFATARFHSTVTGKRLLLLNMGNLLLLVVTLGLGWPWAKIRSIRFTFRYLTLEDLLDVAGIHQEAQIATATGEELAGFLDAGFDLG